MFPLQRKSQVQEVFKVFKQHIETAIGKKIKALQIDKGGEFLVFCPYLEEQGIIHQWSCPNINQEMGFIKQRHRHIVDSRLVLLNHAKLLLNFWYFAFTTSLMIHPMNNYSRSPNLHDLKIFGCRAYSNKCGHQNNKFAFRYEPLVFPRYPRELDENICFNPITGKIVTSKDVIFMENDFGQNPHLQL